MKKLSLFLTVIALLMAVSCGDSSQIAATVDSEKITIMAFNEFCRKKALALGVPALSPVEKRAVLDAMIQREVVYLYAVKKGIKISEAEFRRQSVKQRPLAGAAKGDLEKQLLYETVKQAVTGTVKAPRQEVEQYYLSHKKEFSVPETYRVYLVKVDGPEVSHILRELKKNPAAFDDMALRRSSPELRELNSKATFTPKDQFPESMAPSLEKMKVGETAGPVTVKRGIFLFKLVGRRRAFVTPLADTYAEIEHVLSAGKKDEAFDRWYETIRGDYNVEIKIKDL